MITKILNKLTVKKDNELGSTKMCDTAITIKDRYKR